MNTTFIYALVDPRDGIIKYVGKSDNPHKRLKGHLKQCKDSITLKNRWVAKLKKLGFKPDVIILEEVSVSEWEAAEQRWIEQLIEQGIPLKNGDRGGKGRSGFTVSSETRQKLSVASKGRRVSEATKHSISLANTGRERADEFKQRMSKLATGRVMSETSRQKISQTRKGIPKPDGFGEKVSRVHKGKTLTEETRAKISQSKQGWKPSPEMTETQRLKCSGEGNGRAALNKEKVRAIRETYQAGTVSINELSRRYGVNWSTIKRVISGKHWKGV